MKGLWGLLRVLLLLPAAVRAWEIMVASEGHLNTLTASGDLNEMPTQMPLGTTVALAISPTREYLYLGDSSFSNASIVRLNVESGEMQPVVRKQSSNIYGLALDPMQNVLYWSTGYDHRIMKANVDGHPESPKTVHKFGYEIPQGIAIDSCGRYLFWSNIYDQRPTIERSYLNGSGHKVLVTKDLHVPLGVAVDQAERKLYWSQELDGVYYSIERSDLDGSNREVMRSMHHQPFTLAVGADFIYWTDWINNAIWRKDKSQLVHGTGPTKVHAFSSEPSGIVTYLDGEAKTDAECRAVINAYESRMEATTITSTAATEDITESDWNDDTASDEYCLNSGAVLITKDRDRVCRCLPGFTGLRCETKICFNYCIHGVCSMDLNQGGATCVCDPGYSGLRCEQYVCSEFCLNGGHCSIVEGKPSCDCHETFKGERCEIGPNLSKLCQFYCESEAAGLPSPAGTERQQLCVCPSVRKSEYVVDGFNGTAFVIPSGVNPMFLKNDAALINDRSPALLITFGCICILLLVIVVLLVYKVIQLRKRPRVKKRFIGSKTVTPTPLTNRPSPATDQCEINIENCCNMNICETPCFEPNLRTPRPGSKKEEKKNLLDSMEHSQGGSHDDLY